MMDRSHFKDPFAVSKFEKADLKDNRQPLDKVDDTAEQDNDKT